MPYLGPQVEVRGYIQPRKSVIWPWTFFILPVGFFEVYSPREASDWGVQDKYLHVHGPRALFYRAIGNVKCQLNFQFRNRFDFTIFLKTRIILGHRFRNWILIFGKDSYPLTMNQSGFECFELESVVFESLDFKSLDFKSLDLESLDLKSQCFNWFRNDIWIGSNIWKQFLFSILGVQIPRF